MRLISFDTCSAVILETSTPFTDTSRSPTLTESNSTLSLLMAWTIGTSPFGVSITIPSLPGGARISNRYSSASSANCCSKDASSENTCAFMGPRPNLENVDWLEEIMDRGFASDTACVPSPVSSELVCRNCRA